ncbi:MAG: hypothetical protein WC756_12405 [Taibaiella sp.]|jgi:hypothetical protein
MKLTLTFLFTLCFLISRGQTLQEIDKNLSSAFAKIDYWSDYDSKDDKIDKYDSLEKANMDFEEMLLKYTASNPKTLSYQFKNLSGSGLTILTSEDGLFRIYSWDTYTGGTMHFFKNIFQYFNSKGTFNTVPDSNENGGYQDPGCFYKQINNITSENRTYYVTQSTMIGSSALSYHTIKIFSIDDYGLNDTAKLIKTKTGIRNELRYEMDFSTSSNKNTARTDINYSPEYDPATKTITIPLIDEDGKLTTRKIRYRFNGKYFVKV